MSRTCFDFQAMQHCVGCFRKVNSRLMRARAALLQADVQTALVSIQQAEEPRFKGFHKLKVEPRADQVVCCAFA